jgi:sortase A
MSSSSSVPAEPDVNGNLLVLRAGIVLILVGSGMLVGMFYPILREEITYRISGRDKISYTVLSKREDVRAVNVIRPVDESFGIVVPKIGANAPVVADVDPYDETVYQEALSRGVAHAAGTSYPGEGGPVFLFAHSATDFVEASRYNAIFYLLNKLEPGDDIYLFHNEEKYRYRVTGSTIVDESAVSYLEEGEHDTLTLMTCWPPGTTYRRLVVTARADKPVEGETR